MEISNLTLGRENKRIFPNEASFTLGYKCESREKKRKRKKINWSKIEEKQKKRKEKERFVEPDNVWTMCRIVRKKENSNNDLVKTWGMRHVITCLVTNQIFVFALVPCWPKDKKVNKKGKGPEHPKADSPPKSNFLKNIVDGKWLTKSNHDMSVVRN